MTDAINPIYVFIDESGNLDFSDKGTDYFVLSAFITNDPMNCGHALNALTYEFLARGFGDQIPFHATENSEGTRKRVMGAMCPSTHDCWAHSIYADKHLAHPSKHSPEVFYALLGKALGKYLLNGMGSVNEPIVLMFDSALTSKQQAAFLKAVKPSLNALHVRYQILFRPVKHDVNGQIADYFAWSLFRKLERNDPTWLDSLPITHTRFNIFQYGHTRYW